MSLSSITTEQIIFIVIAIIAYIPSIVLHECAHGFAAYKLGDPTAKNAGRLTLNPIKHVDPFGTVILPALLLLSSVFTGGGIMFGYAKPVPYNPRYFKNIRKGELIVGLAGPASNIVLALIGAAIAFGANHLFTVIPNGALYIWYFGYYFCMVNLWLAFFNIIPIPPLDGSSIIACFLSDKALMKYYQFQRYAMVLFFIVVLILPYMFNIDIVGWWLDLTAGNIGQLLLG